MNPSWPEVIQACGDTAPSERYDVVARVFNIKLKAFIGDIKSGRFGPTIGDLMVVEWQKRGLPHAHLLLFFAPNAKMRRPEDYDMMVCAEIPDPTLDADLHFLVLRHMLQPRPPSFLVNTSCMEFRHALGGDP